MNAKLTFIILILLCTGSTLIGQNTITIFDESKLKAGQETLNSHKDKDVTITRFDSLGINSYLVYMYRMDNGNLKSYFFLVAAKNEFDYHKASYTWVNDSTMTFKLINSEKNISENFRMTGVGNHSQISREN